MADVLLDLALSFAPNDELLKILEEEQLPKLKGFFEIPHKATMRKKSLAQMNSNPIVYSNSKFTSNFSVESTPKTAPKPQNTP